MIKPLRTQFVIADSSRARWVARSEHADDFVTVKELHASHQSHGHPTGVAFEGYAGQRFNIGERDAAVQQHRLHFANDVAEAINAESEAGETERLAVIAPARMLTAIRQRLGAQANARLAKTLSKDLTKTPDHELGDWLRRLEQG